MSAANITIKTNVTPDVSFDPTSKAAAQSPSGLLHLLQPSIDADIPILGKVHFAPYGEPTGIGVLILFAILALALYGAYKLLR